MRAGLLAAALLLAGCVTAGAPPPPAPVTVEPRAVDPALDLLTRFVGAVKAQRFGEALALTSRRWRAGLTDAQFAADFAAEPLAAQRLARLEQALPAGLAHQGDRALLSWEGQPLVALVREDGAWRVDALTR